MWNTPSVVDSRWARTFCFVTASACGLGLLAFGQPSGLNMNGTDLIPQIARATQAAAQRCSVPARHTGWNVARQKLESLRFGYRGEP